MIVEHRTVGRTLAALAIPTAAAILADQLLGIADTIVVGTLGATALAAVTAGTTVYIVIAFLVHGLGRGAAILAAQSVGAGDMARFGAIVRASLIVPGLLAVGLDAAVTAFAAPALAAMVGHGRIAADGAQYLTVRSLAMLPLVISGAAVTAFSAVGDTRFSFRLLVAINAVHIPLLFVLALGWATHHPLGVMGAGLSSLLAEVAGSVYAAAVAWRRPELRIFERLSFETALVLRATQLGVPEAVYLFFIVAPDIAIVSILAPLGPPTVAGFRVLMLMADATWSVPGSLGEAAQIVLGQRFGAGDLGGARRFEQRARRYALSWSTGCGAFVAIGAWPIAFACTLDAAVATLTALPLAIHMLTLPLKGYAMIGIARVRAAGDTRFSMIVGVLAGLIVLPLTAVGVRVLHIGLYAVPLGWVTAWALWCAATAIRLRRFDWTRARIAA